MAPGAPNAVCWWMPRRTHCRELQDFHLRMLKDAKHRGLTNAQTADEFNRLGVTRAGGGRWTAEVVRARGAYINRVTRQGRRAS